MLVGIIFSALFCDCGTSSKSEFYVGEFTPMSDSVPVLERKLVEVINQVDDTSTSPPLIIKQDVDPCNICEMYLEDTTQGLMIDGYHYERALDIPTNTWVCTSSTAPIFFFELRKTVQVMYVMDHVDTLTFHFEGREPIAIPTEQFYNALQSLKEVIEYGTDKTRN